MSETGDADVDAELDRLESDLGSVEAALDALDADELDRAEELAAALNVDDGDVAEAPAKSSGDGPSNAI